MPKQKIEIEVDVLKGYEATGEFRPPASSSDVFLDEYGEIRTGGAGWTMPRIILRRVKQYREPVLPADAGKKVEFANDIESSVWIVGQLGGWLWCDGYPWRNQNGYSYKFCRIEKEPT